MLVLAAASSCGDPPPPERAAAISIDSAGVRVVTSDPRNSDTYCALSDEPTLTLGVVEGEEPHMFYWVRGANRLSDGTVAVLNNGTGEIRIFGADGRHLRSMGGKGEGPGEFRIGRYIWVLPGDTLWVGDYRPWRYHVYQSVDKAPRAPRAARRRAGKARREGNSRAIRPRSNAERSLEDRQCILNMTFCKIFITV